MPRLGAWRGPGLAMLAMVIALVGCTTTPASRPGPVPAASRTAPATSGAMASSTRADPATWVGRWQGNAAQRLDVAPADGDRLYTLIFRNDQGVRVTRQARASGGRLFYQGGAGNLSLRAGTGAETGDPSQRMLTQCLIVVPGGPGYCRRADNAGALALQHGAFVAVRQACDQATPADTLFFDGRDLVRADGPSCHSQVVSQQGMVFSLAQRCSPSGMPSRETVSVPDETHLALSGPDGDTRLYRYCATPSLPPALGRRAPD